MQNKTTKNRYYLIHHGDDKNASYAVVGIEAVYDQIKWEAENGRIDYRIREVSLREWVAEQISWEEDGTDLEREAGIYQLAADLAKQDMENQ